MMKLKELSQLMKIKKTVEVRKILLDTVSNRYMRNC